MTDAPIELTGSFRKTLDTMSPLGIIDVFNAATIFNPYTPLENSYFVGYSLQLEKLQLTVDLPSFQKAPIPNIAPEDTQAERNAKLSEIESRFAKVGLYVYQDSGEGYKRTAVVTLQNRDSEYYQPILSPYLTLAEVELLGKNDKLGVQITNLGNGLLGVGDYLIIAGNWKAKISFIGKTIGGVIPTTENFGVTIEATSTLIRPNNNNRKTIWLTNSGSKGAYIYFGEGEALNYVDNAPYLAPGGSITYESDRFNLPQAIWGIAPNGNTRITGLEAA